MARTDSATAVPALLAARGLLRAEETWRGACPAWDLVVHTLRDSYPQPAPTPAALQARMEAVAGEEPVGATAMYSLLLPVVTLAIPAPVFGICRSDTPT